MKFKSYFVVFHCAVISVLILLFSYAGASITFAEDSPKKEILLAADDSRSVNPETLIQEEVIEDSHQPEELIRHPHTTMPRKSYLQINGFYKNYMPADGSATYASAPFLFRTNIAKNTDWWIASDTITKQYPNCGINDIVTGFKWNFRPDNPSMALIAGAQLNTAGSNVGDNAFEPQVGIAFDYEFNPKWATTPSKWETSFNVIYKYLWDSTAQQRYNQYTYINETYYALNKDQKVSLGAMATCPNAAPIRPKGVNVTRAFVGYFWNPKENLFYSIHIAKGLSFVDINWSIIGGIGWSL